MKTGANDDCGAFPSGFPSPTHAEHSLTSHHTTQQWFFSFLCSINDKWTRLAQACREWPPGRGRMTSPADFQPSWLCPLPLVRSSHHHRRSAIQRGLWPYPLNCLADRPQAIRTACLNSPRICLPRKVQAVVWCKWCAAQMPQPTARNSYQDAVPCGNVGRLSASAARKLHPRPEPSGSTEAKVNTKADRHPHQPARQCKERTKSVEG